MSKTLTIKKVPDRLVKLLHRRAVDNHRSVQGELITILEDTLMEGRKLSIAEFRRENARLGFRTPSESTKIIREARDARARG
jgi:plasmid stability protein